MIKTQRRLELAFELQFRSSKPHDHPLLGQRGSVQGTVDDTFPRYDPTRQ